MATYRIGWLAPGAKLRIGEIVEHRLGQWAEQWIGAEGRNSLSLEIDEVAESFAAFGPMIWLSIQHSRNGCLHLGVEVDKIHLIGQHLLLMDRAAAPEFAYDVAKHALQSLVERVFSETDSEALEGEGPEYPALSYAWGSVLYGRIRGLAATAWIVADRVWCDKATERDSDTSYAPKLQPRKSLLGAQGVAVNAVLDLGEMDLTEALALRVGDVLVGDASVDAGVKLLSCGCVVADGMLLDAGGKRSVSIV